MKNIHFTEKHIPCFLLLEIIVLVIAIVFSFYSAGKVLINQTIDHVTTLRILKSQQIELSLSIILYGKD